MGRSGLVPLSSVPHGFANETVASFSGTPSSSSCDFDWKFMLWLLGYTNLYSAILYKPHKKVMKINGS
jgi:hypothetical protein